VRERALVAVFAGAHFEILALRGLVVVAATAATVSTLITSPLLAATAVGSTAAPAIVATPAVLLSAELSCGLVVVIVLSLRSQGRRHLGRLSAALRVNHGLHLQLDLGGEGIVHLSYLVIAVSEQARVGLRARALRLVVPAHHSLVLLYVEFACIRVVLGSLVAFRVISLIVVIESVPALIIASTWVSKRITSHHGCGVLHLLEEGAESA
jgi:hypothetical protein